MRANLLALGAVIALSGAAIGTSYAGVDRGHATAAPRAQHVTVLQPGQYAEGTTLELLHSVAFFVEIGWKAGEALFDYVHGSCLTADPVAMLESETLFD